eukprot:COSAG04_NODE_851_length_9869_cov_12.480450_3_plen_361_part_00
MQSRSSHECEHSCAKGIRIRIRIKLSCFEIKNWVVRTSFFSAIQTRIQVSCENMTTSPSLVGTANTIANVSPLVPVLSKSAGSPFRSRHRGCSGRCSLVKVIATFTPKSWPHDPSLLRGQAAPLRLECKGRKEGGTGSRVPVGIARVVVSVAGAVVEVPACRAGSGRGEAARLHGPGRQGRAESRSRTDDAAQCAEDARVVEDPGHAVLDGAADHRARAAVVRQTGGLAAHARRVLRLRLERHGWFDVGVDRGVELLGHALGLGRREEPREVQEAELREELPTLPVGWRSVLGSEGGGVSGCLGARGSGGWGVQGTRERRREGGAGREGISLLLGREVGVVEVRRDHVHLDGVLGGPHPD